MGGMASWWAGELLLLFPSVSPVTLQATRRVCERKKKKTLLHYGSKMVKNDNSDPETPQE